MSPDQSEDPAGLRQLAIQVARQCGLLVAQAFGQEVRVKSSKSSLTDIVTPTDEASEELAQRLLCSARPQDGFFGEEGAASANDSGLTWVVDPIDGTVNFAYGIAHCAVSVAVVRGDVTRRGQWQPVAGCVHNPITGHTFHAALGQGATLESPTQAVRQLHLAEPPPLDQALVATGFSYSTQDRAQQAQVLTKLLPLVRDIRRTGSAALDLCAVAGGQVDAYYERGCKAWDMAAGWLIVTEAGGQVVEIPGPDGDSQQQSTVIAAPSLLAGQLQALLYQAGTHA